MRFLGSRYVGNAFTTGGLRWGSLQRSVRPLAGFKGPASEGMGGEGRDEGMGGKGEERKGAGRSEGEGREGEGGRFDPHYFTVRRPCIQ